MKVHPHREGSQNERGIALISALLILVLLAIAGATFMQTASGERSIASNVNVARASLLSADAGVRTSQQVLANLGKAKLDSLIDLWGGTGQIITSPGTLFPAGNLPAVTASTPNFTATSTIAWADTDMTPTSQAYDFLYTITSTGTVGAYGQRQVMSTGMLRVSAARGSFSDYLMYTNHHTSGSGSAIWFTSSSQFDGRVHTNDEFRFAFQPGFQDKVTSVDNNAWYYNNNSPIEKAGSSNGTIDVPDFFGGFQRNADNVPLPTDSYNQQSAAAGLSPTATSAPSNSSLRTQFGLSAGSSAPPTGVYVPTTPAGGSTGNVVSGGIYVQGTADQLKMVADTVNHRQQYIIKQGSNTTTITIDRAANTTTTQLNSTTAKVLVGTPRGVTFVNGSVSDLRGPDRSGSTVLPALEHSEQMLVASTGDIVVQRDVTCEDFSNGGQNVLGLFSSGGDVVIGTSAPNDMNLDAYVMAAGSNGEFRVENYNSGSPRGTLHMRGGCVQQYYGAFFTFNSSGVLQTGYARDWHYDRRGLIPPYYPTTVQFDSDQPSARTLSWKEI